jgi:spectinomycin phosphotransferase
VDIPPPDAIDEPLLTAALGQHWGIHPRLLRYEPKGAGSYHWAVEDQAGEPYFVAVDDLDTKPWIGPDRASTRVGLAAAYETAWWLRHQAGLELVVAPCPAGDGSMAVPLTDQYTLAVFPFIAGPAGEWGQRIDDDEAATLLRQLARLHTASPEGLPRIARRGHRLPERDALRDALAALGEPWSGGPYAERSRAALSDHAPRVVARLARFDALAAGLAGAAQRVVVTHGEPHPGNLIHTRAGLRLIDWDTVALAEPERDLWMLADHPGGLERYTEATGTEPDPRGMEFYRLAWTLSDIAAFAHMFRREHGDTDWFEFKWNGFVHLLAGGESTPYGL